VTGKTKEIALQVLRFDSLPSTNLEAARHASEGAPEGLFIVAAEQTAGRGRLQRHWASPKNAGIYVSVILRPGVEQKLWPLITLMAAVAVHDVLFETCGLQTDIKWPNDVLFNEKKLCGILADSIETDMGPAVILGIGINLNDNAFPFELRQIATSIQAATSQLPDAELLLTTLASRVIDGYKDLHVTDGPARLIAAYSKRSSYCRGKHVRVIEENDSFTGVTRGIESDGALRIEIEEGTMHIVRAGDVEQLRPLEH
jgi:BirA family transcriptional regulator, biotin operon repressor / biotin---[acetyl-CoA-carboxylase] ligase